MTTKPTAIIAAAVVSLALFWAVAVLALRLTAWLCAHPHGFPEGIVLFPALAFSFAMIAIARRRSTHGLARRPATRRP